MSEPTPAPIPPADPTAATPLSYEPPPRRRVEWGTWISWAVIVATVGLIFGANLLSSRHERRAQRLAAEDPAKQDSVQLKMAGYSAIPSHRFAQSTGVSKSSASNDDDLVKAVRDAAESPVDRLRTVPLIAEIKGPAAALTELDGLSLPPPPAKAPPEASLAPDVSSLRTIYGQGAGRPRA